MRTVHVSKANLHKVTSDYASVGLLSILEPLLGVANCSLPVLWPVFHLLAEKFNWNKGHSGSMEDGRPSFLRSIQSIGTKPIRPKVHDPYPLDTIITASATQEIDIGKDFSIETPDPSDKL